MVEGLEDGESDCRQDAVENVFREVTFATPRSSDGKKCPGRGAESSGT